MEVVNSCVLPQVHFSQRSSVSIGKKICIIRYVSNNWCPQLQNAQCNKNRTQCTKKAVVSQNSSQRNMVTVSSVVGEVIDYYIHNKIQHPINFPYVVCLRCP